MSDIAQILGVTAISASSSDLVPAPAVPPPPKPPSQQPSKAIKLQSLPKEVVKLLEGSHADEKGSEALDLPTRVPTLAKPVPSSAITAHEAKVDVVKVGNKLISTSKPARKWAWAPFSSSARTDGAIFHHWVRANVEYPDYPYARFDIHLDPVTFNDEEYNTYLQSDTWSKSQTDFLLELARRFELRWPIIHDRWLEAFGMDCVEKVEDLQHRYYSVAAKLNAARIAQEAAKEVQNLVAASKSTAEESKGSGASEAILMETAAARALAASEMEQQPPIAHIGTGTSNKAFDLEYERARRAHMEALWNRSKEDELEEIEIRKELKLVEAQLRKLKKAGRHVLAAAKGQTQGVGAPGGGGLPGIHPTALDQAFESVAPQPVPQVPYLQSARLVPPATGGSAGINKALLTRMDEILALLKVPSKPLPTKRVCDLYDQVRRDALTLLVCQKQAIQKEGSIQSKRIRLAKLSGENRVIDEETLLGIAPSVPVASSPVARTKSKSAGPGGKSKANQNTGAATGTSGSSKTKGAKVTTSAGSAPPVALKPDAPPSMLKASTSVGADVTKSGGKKSGKRKRKPETVASPGPVAPPSGTGQATPAIAASSAPDDAANHAKKRPKKSNI